jgi:hypothetical protein
MDLSTLEVSGGVNAVDPNVLLNTLREAAKDTLAALDDVKEADSVTANEAALAEAFLQLDDWMSRGGFPPQPWQTDTE